MKLHLIHWKEPEAEPRVSQLESLGHQVAYVPFDGGSTLKKIRASLPQAILIDLTRVPSHGRAVAIEVRRNKDLRAIPLVFVDGVEEKVAPLRKLFPDAVFTDWKRIGPVLKKLKAPVNPIVPVSESSFERYQSTPLHKKLGLKPGMKAVLLNAPASFDRAAADFPQDIEYQERLTAGSQIVLLFAKSKAELEAGLDNVMRKPHGLPLWIFWPKKAATKNGGIKTDLTQFIARTAAHEFGYTDYKVCSFDSTWSGFLFGVKRK